ncbi:MAG: DUF2130 domain-containing protein [Flavobacterium sp.]|nr:MAG: DUF2130 domain-containing protein [Flavobacterium sp.]
MASEIKCPSCGHQFEPNEAIREEVQNELRHKIKEWQEKKDEEFALKLEQERKQLKSSLEENMRKSITADFENQLQLLKSANNDSEEKLRLARKKELEFLQLEQQLKNKEAELEITLQKKLQVERTQLSEQIQKQEAEKSSLEKNELLLKLKEKEVQLEEQKKLAEEMRRRAEQSSMQRQGEAQELLLEAILKESFPFDLIDEVGKGVEGADCIQIVRNASGKECGKIIYESKRTKGWSSNWIDKLKNDMRSRGADIAILVTQTFPKDMERFGQKDGIWICSFAEAASVASILRHGVITAYEIQCAEENKGDKMQLLYNYLTGVEFKGQVEAIAEGFIAMRNSITKERMQMEKLWKEREKQLEKVLISTSGLYGSVKGIAGASVGNIPLLDGGDTINEIEY